MRIEFRYARGPDHFAGYPGLGERNASPVVSYVIAAVPGLAGAAVVVVALIGHEVRAAPWGLCGVLLGVGIAVAARQRVRSALPAAAMEPRRWVITEGGIEIAHADGSVAMAWPAFSTMMALRHAYLLVLKDPGDPRTFDIPRGPLTDADDAAVREVIARHGITFRPVGV